MLKVFHLYVIFCESTMVSTLLYRKKQPNRETSMVQPLLYTITTTKKTLITQTHILFFYNLIHMNSGAALVSIMYNSDWWVISANSVQKMVKRMTLRNLVSQCSPLLKRSRSVWLFPKRTWSHGYRHSSITCLSVYLSVCLLYKI